MKKGKQKIIVAFVFITMLTTVNAAYAESWSRSGPKGSVSRSIDDGTASVSRSGENGGTISRTTQCKDGSWGCTSSFEATTQDGNSYSGTRETYRGPQRGRSVTTITGPEGNTLVRPNRWRR
ncbi:MAG: hypothetical protein QNJ17_15930 [Desulfocapsaceae bacterium]|nr:hypothetical protein [Desulfocapsaceae bacterium]